MEFNETMNEYYITIDDITNNTPYSSDDLNGVFGEVKMTLKNISHAVYRLMYSYYNGMNPHTHKTFIQRKIGYDMMDEQTQFKLACIEAVKGAVESGMDLNAYTNEPKDTFPSTVYDELRIAKMLDKSEKIIR